MRRADHSPELRHDIEQNFAQALAYLKQHEDFDSFDRITFIREYAEPIFEDGIQCRDRIHLVLPL